MPSLTRQARIEVFVSCALADKPLQEQLLKHLKPFERQGEFSIDCDLQIEAGKEFEREITTFLNRAHIILLLVSCDFLGVETYYNRAVQAMDRFKAGEADVIPIILRPVNWRDAPFGKLQQLPRNGTPVVNWSDKDEAFKNITQEICATVRKLTSEKEELPTNDLLFQIRERCREKICNQHILIRLLNLHEIRVDELYVDMCLLDRPEYAQQGTRNNITDHLRSGNDRPRLGKRIGVETLGIEVVKEHRKLVILGKPGSGKTTFLKYLALCWCNNDDFFLDLLCALIECRQIRDDEWSLPNTIKRELDIEDQGRIEKILNEGRLLLLIDGLDEISKSELRTKILEQIAKFSIDFSENRFILTCRTQIIENEMDLVGFKFVELADFKKDQVIKFSEKWFDLNREHEKDIVWKWDEFVNAINKNIALSELTTTPLLLTLMCLVFQKEKEIHLQAHELYEKGIKLLLGKWNNKKSIKGWEVGSKIYQLMSSERKKEMLTEIAVQKFKDPSNYFLFSQSEITQLIMQFLNLKDFDEGLEVLKTIESQHGLLIERADSFWSFSHFTFQEYLILEWLTGLSPSELVQIISDNSWQNHIIKLIESKHPCENLFSLIKEAIDQILTSDPTLQYFLTWLSQKSKSVQEMHSSEVVIRALYFELTLHVENALEKNNVSNHDLSFKLAISLDRSCDHGRNLNFSLDYNLARILVLANALGFDSPCSSQSSGVFRARVRELTDTFSKTLKCAHTLDSNNKTELSNSIETLMTIPKISEEGLDNCRKWWIRNGKHWTEKFCRWMMDDRNLGEDWKFSKEQIKKLQDYHDANLFLAKLLQIQEEVGNVATSQIKNTLLLPEEELQSYNS